MPYDQSVRTLMNSAGYDNNKIGYDSNSGYVTYDKQPFMKPQMNVNGTGYTDQATFDNSHNQYKQQNPDMFYASGSTGTPAGAAQSGMAAGGSQSATNPYQGGIFTSKDDSMPYEQRLAYYANNPNALHDEYNRSQQALGAYQAIAGTGNPEATQHVNDATAHIQKLQQIMNAQPQNKGPDINGLVNSVYQRVMNPQPYDVYSSPEYAAQKSASDYASQQAVRQAQESMGASGFGRSTNLADRAQTIQQGANERLLAQVVPQLLAQHRAQEQQQTGNLMGLITPIMQQQQNQFSNNLETNKFNLEKQGQQFNQGIESNKFDYQKLQDQVKNGQWDKNFDLEMSKWADQKGLNWAQLDMETKKAMASLAIEQNRLGIEGMNAQTSRMNAESSQKTANFNTDPNSPHNKYYDSMSNYRDNGANNMVDKPYQDAMSLAIKADPMLFSKPQEVQDQIINGIYNKLKAKQPQSGSSNGGGLSDEDIAKYLK